SSSQRRAFCLRQHGTCPILCVPFCRRLNTPTRKSYNDYIHICDTAGELASGGHGPQAPTNIYVGAAVCRQSRQTAAPTLSFLGGRSPPNLPTGSMPAE